jgi:hypothetical protein
METVMSNEAVAVTSSRLGNSPSLMELSHLSPAQQNSISRPGSASGYRIKEL